MSPTELELRKYLHNISANDSLLHELLEAALNMLWRIKKSLSLDSERMLIQLIIGSQFFAQDDEQSNRLAQMQEKRREYEQQYKNIAKEIDALRYRLDVLHVDICLLSQEVEQLRLLENYHQQRAHWLSQCNGYQNYFEQLRLASQHANNLRHQIAPLVTDIEQKLEQFRNLLRENLQDNRDSYSKSEERVLRS